MGGVEYDIVTWYDALVIKKTVDMMRVLATCLLMVVPIRLPGR
jgi:hypothetical protein